MLQNIICEGLDRLGKSTLVDNLKQRLGHFTSLHYSKPELLSYYELRVGRGKAHEFYQRDSFGGMFKLLASDARVIMDRGHLGEMVYAHRYRGYDGSYVLDLEQGKGVDNTLLVLLVNHDVDLEARLVDDGLGFDWGKRKEEQEDFITAFRRSKISHKALINVGRQGHFIDQAEIIDAVSQAYLKAAWYTSIDA
jgi:thymidylate kinase